MSVLLKTHNYIKSYEWLDARMLELRLPSCVLRISFLESGIVRCHYSSASVLERIPSYGIDSAYIAHDVVINEREWWDSYEISTTEISLRIRKRDAGLEFRERTTGTPLSIDAEGMGNKAQEHSGDDLVWVHKQMPKEAHFYGLGDKPCNLNMRGKRFEMWGSDHYKFKPESDPLYKSIPFFYCLNEKSSYGIYFDNTMRSYFDFGKENPERLIFGSNGGAMDYYLISAKSALDVVKSYTRLTGLPPMPPLWALGYHQSKWSYYPQEAVSRLADKFRSKCIPCDAIHMDIHHMNQHQSLTWDRIRFPDPPGMIRDLEKKGFKCVSIVNPGIKINPDNFIWRSGFEANVYCRRHDGALLEGEVWPGKCNFPDFTNPHTREWWSERFYRQVGDYAVRGIWVDMNEPAIFPDKTFPDDTRHAYDGYSCSHLKAHNVYGQCMAMASRQGMQKAAPQRRPFVLSRAGFAGLQRYAATWTGDNEADWTNLKMANMQVQRLSASGISFAGSDTGGFLGHPTPELFCRWMQMSAFHPFFRNHSNGEFGGQEPWCFGKDVEEHCRRALEQRYRLLPYLYSAFFQYSSEGTPIVRSLNLIHSDNCDSYWRSSEYYLGDSLYIVPIHRPEETGRSLYLPPGKWYSLWDDKAAPFSDAECWVETPLKHIPVYVKGGNIIPRWPIQQYSDQLGAGHPYIYELWWAADSNQNSICYQDAGDGLSYLDGDYSLSKFHYEAGSRELCLSRELSGSYQPKNQENSLLIHSLPHNITPKLYIDGHEQSCPPIDNHNILKLTITRSVKEVRIVF